jgi:phenylacetate-CoA ligase
MGIINRIIKKQPTVIKKLYYNIVPFRDRYGKLFGETLDFLRDVDSWSYDRAKEYQLNELKKLLIHCKNNVPFYGKMFADYEFDVNINSVNDIDCLPILTKDIINKNFDDMQAVNFNGNKILFRTSGSTGERMKFYGDDSMFKKEAAYILHSYQSHGGNLYDDWSVWIRRHSPKDENDLVVKDYELKRIYLSPFHLNDEHIHNYVEIINRTKTTTIVTYPSTAYWLACMIEKHNLKLPYVKCIHAASEKCLEPWGVKVKEVFGFDLKMHYGLVEKASFMYQSSESNYYHEDLTYSFTEFAKDGAIIGTPFMNYVMPFLRYQTNDIVTLNKDVKFDSSRPLTVTEIDGRADDMIVSQNGTRIPSVNFYTVMHKVDQVKMFQLHQKSDKSIEFKVVLNKFTDDLFSKLEKEIKKRVGNLPVRFEIVDEIARDPKTGKIRCVLTDVK